MRNHVQLADAYYRLSDEERKYGESASITNQWDLLKLSPREYYAYLTTGVYPLPSYRAKG